MKLTKERKLLFGGLAAALAILAIDQLSGGKTDAAPASASAPVTAETVNTPAVSAQVIAPTVAETPTAPANLSQRLNEAVCSLPADSSFDRDIFRTISQSASAVTADSNAFRQSHKLTGVIVSQGAAKVMIDGKLLAVGQRIDGFQLASVGRNSAVFRSANERIELTLAE